MPDQIDEQTKQDRYDIIMREQLAVSSELNEKMIGKTLTVLCEGFDPVSESYYGRSASDAPDIDTKVFFTNELGKKRVREGEFVRIKIDEILDYDLVGKIIREGE